MSLAISFAKICDQSAELVAEALTTYLVGGLLAQYPPIYNVFESVECFISLTFYRRQSSKAMMSVWVNCSETDFAALSSLCPDPKVFGHALLLASQQSQIRASWQAEVC